MIWYYTVIDFMLDKEVDLEKMIININEKIMMGLINTKLFIG